MRSIKEYQNIRKGIFKQTFHSKKFDFLAVWFIFFLGLILMVYGITKRNWIVVGVGILILIWWSIPVKSKDEKQK